VKVVEQQHGTRMAAWQDRAGSTQNDRLARLTFCRSTPPKARWGTGLLYVDPTRKDLHHHLDTVETALNTLDERPLVRAPPRWDKATARMR